MRELERRIGSHLGELRAIAHALGRSDLIIGDRLRISSETRRGIMSLLDDGLAITLVLLPEHDDRLAFQLVCACIETADDTMLVIRRRAAAYLC